jgi:nitrogen fixation protein NifU and related proteins
MREKPMENRASILIDHYRKPRCRGVIPDAVLRHEIHNRKCGDRLSFTLKLEDQTVCDIRFEGAGCFYCIASASILCSTMTGKTLSVVREDVARFRAWLADPETEAPPSPPPGAGPAADADRDNDLMRALGEVKAYPMRIECVDLAWKGVKDMLDHIDAR